jgi:hypothetical protein
MFFVDQQQYRSKIHGDIADGTDAAALKMSMSDRALKMSKE